MMIEMTHSQRMLYEDLRRHLDELVRYYGECCEPADFEDLLHEKIYGLDALLERIKTQLSEDDLLRARRVRKAG